MGSYWDDAGWQNQPTSSAGYFLNFNVGDGGVVGGTLTYIPGSGFDLFVDAGFGTSGVTAGYTNSVDGFLNGWSATYNSDNTLWGAGQAFNPWADNYGLQYGAMTLGTPGGSVTYGVEFKDFLDDVANGIDNIILNH